VSGSQITVVIPTVPPRAKLLARAVRSVEKQQGLDGAPVLLVEIDTGREGPAVVRNRGVKQVQTPWVAFCDDDDELLPHHLSTLAAAAAETGADLVWPWFEVVGGTDPFPQHRGRQWDPEDPHQIPVTVLLRTGLFREVGGFRQPETGRTDRYGNRAGEDFDLWCRLSEAGARFHHVDEITWRWHHWGGNSSGLPSRIPWKQRPRRGDVHA